MSRSPVCRYWLLDEDQMTARQPTPSGSLEYVLGCSLARFGHVWLAYRTDRTGD